MAIRGEHWLRDLVMGERAVRRERRVIGMAHNKKKKNDLPFASLISIHSVHLRPCLGRKRLQLLAGKRQTR